MWLLLALATLTAACGGPGPALGGGPVDLAAAPGAADAARLTGAGSTFVAPLVAAWAAQYQGVGPGVQIRYEPVGSPAGVDRLRRRDVEFAASDVPLTDLQEVLLGGSRAVAQVPWAAGAVAIVYHLPGVDELRLTPAVVAAIFSGSIRRWNAEALRADNPARALPDLAIEVVRRSDPSGTTAILGSFLQATAPEVWGLGAESALSWPVGRGVAGSTGMVDAVAQRPGSIGYVALGHARRDGVGVALLQNRAGRFVAPSQGSVEAALGSASLRPRQTTLDLHFTTESISAYPLSTVSYLLYRRDLVDPARAMAMRHFADWVLSEGQRSAAALGYLPVPQRLRAPAAAALQQPS